MSNFAAKMHSVIWGTKRSVLWFFASCIIAVFASVTLTHAAFNKQLNYQGKLTNASNVAVANGTYNMEFKLYTVSSGGVAIWTETRTGADKVQVTSGLFSVMLGEVNPLTGVNFNQTLYLGVNIGGTGTPSWDGEMTPRKKLGAVPAAVEAENLGGASASQYLRSDIAATSSVTDNTNAAFTVAQLGTGNIFDVLDGATKVLTVLDGGNVGIGDATPAALFTVGNGDLFQVNSSGAIAAATGITSSGNVILKPFGTSAGQTTETRFLELAANGTEYAGFKAPDSLVASIVWTLPSSDSSGCVQSDGSGHLLIASCLAGGGGGTVTSFSAGNLSPLFTTSVSTPTTTPALGFTLSNAAANTWFGNNTGSSAAPSYNAAGTLSKTDDTNVTLTLGGTPAGSLLNAVSITAGWTGQLAVGRGGTGASTFTGNGVLYGNGTSAIGATAAGTNGQLLVGVTGGAPSFVSLSGDASITNTGVLTVGTNAITYGKFQQVAANSLVGNATGSLANATNIGLGAGLAFSAGNLITSNIPNSSLQNSSITVALGTTGTDANVSGSPVSLGGTLTLNLPTASASNRGLLSSTDWSTFNGKENALTFNNGLTRTTNTVKLGGALTADTTISGGSFNFIVDTTGGVVLGDTSASGNSTYLSLDDTTQYLAFYSQGGQPFLELNAGGGTYKMGATMGGTHFAIDDIANTFTFNQGYVGIGTTPTSALDVLANATDQTSSTSVANITNGGATFDTTGGDIESDAGVFSSLGTRTAGSNLLTNVGIFATASGGDYNYAAIFDQGEVGIGTTTPENKLHVVGTGVSGTEMIARFDSAAQYAGFFVNNTSGRQAKIVLGQSGSEKWQFGIDLFGTGINTDFYLYDNTSGRNPLYVAVNGDVRLGGTSGATNTQAVTILQTGEVGIGDTTPSALFTVGNGDLFRVNSSGAIAAATGITTTGNVTLSTAPTTSAGSYDILTRNTATGVIEKVASNTYLTGNQTITLSGDVSGSGSTAITTTIGNNAVTYAKFQQVAASSIVGNPTGSLANAQGITLGAGLAFSGTSLVTSNIPNSSLQNSSITVATGTSGSDFNVSGSPVSLGGTITFNIPDAGTSARGLVTTGTQTFAGNKTINGNFSVVSNASEPTSALTVNTSSSWTNAASRLASFKNNGTEVVGITHSGGIVMGSNVATNWGDPSGEALLALRDTSAGDVNLSEIALATSDKAGGTFFNLASNYGYFDTWGYAGDWRTWQQANNSSGNNTIYDLHTLPTDISLTLQVNGNVKTRLNPTQADGATAIPFYFNTATTLATSGAKIVSFQNAGSEKFYVDKDGKGYFAGAIAQAPAAAANLSNYLQTNQSNAANTTTLNPGVLVYNDGHPWGMDLGYNNSRYRTRIFASDIGDIALSYVTGTNPTGQSNFTDALVVRGDSGGAGNIGINVLTPTSRLDVLNNVTGLAVNMKVANFSNAGSTFNTTSGALTSYTGYFSSTSTRSAGLNTLTNVGLYATASGAQNNYAAIFDQGNVGIGTTTPGAKLEVKGSSGIASTTGDAFFGDSSTNDGIGIGHNSGNYSWMQSFNTKPLVINPLGNNVGIGSSATPVDPLQVNGAFRITGSASARTALTSSVTYDYVSSGSYARIESWGGNSSTRGGLVFRQSASDGTLGQEPFSIDSAGKTTLGTGTTATQLVVNGGNASSTAGQLLLTNGSGQALYTGVGNGGGFMYIVNQDLTYWANGAGNINLTASGGSINVTGNLLPATSDTVALGSTTKMFSDLFLASGSVINWNNGDVTLTHSADTLTVAGGTLVTPTLTVSGLTSGRVPYVTTGGQLTDTGAFTWNNSTNQLSLSNGATGASEFIYMGTSTTNGLSIQSADINTNAFMVLGDGASGGTIAFGGTASVDFLPTITLKPNNATFPYGMMLVQTADTGTVPAYNIDARQAAGALATQPLFGIQSYGGTAAFQVNADSTTWFNAAILPRTSDGAALGSTSKMWSDFFLASGGVIDWNAGASTLTHSTNNVTLGGSGATNFVLNNGYEWIKRSGSGAGVYVSDTTQLSANQSWGVVMDASTNLTFQILDSNLSLSSTPLTIGRSTGNIVANTGSIILPATKGLYLDGGSDTYVTESAANNIQLVTGGTGRVDISSSGLNPVTSDGLALGSTSKMWSDLFLASGSVLNFNNGDATITHSADLLTLGGANLAVSNLATGGTAPTTTGTTKMVITDANGQLSFTNVPAGGSTTLNSILAATGTNTIDNAAYSQEWQWNSLTTGTGMKLSSTSVSSGSLLDLTVNSTAAASDTQKALNISTSGTNATIGMTTYGAYVSNAHAGTSSTNVAMYLTATGGTANRALIIPSGGGRVGIGTTSPTYLMDVVENSTGFAPAINIANSDTSTTSYAQIAFTGSGRTFGTGVGNSTETTNGLANKYFIYDFTSNAVRFVVDTNGSVGIGDSTPNSLFTVGINDAFQINSSGQITNGSIASTFGSINIGANNFTTTGTVFGNTLDRSTAGALAIGSTATSINLCNSTACDTINIGTNADADSIVLGDTSYLDTITLNGKLDAKNAGTGLTTAALKVGSFTNSGGTFNTTSAAITQYTGYFANTATRSTGSNALTNVGLYASASGAQNNYAAIFDQGYVGIGTTTPSYPLHIYSSANTADLLRVMDSGSIGTNTNTYGVTIMGKNTYFSTGSDYPVLSVGDTSHAAGTFGISLEAKNYVYNVPTLTLGFTGAGGALDMWNYRSWQADGNYGMRFTTQNGAGSAAVDRLSIGGNADTVDVLFKNSNVGIGATSASSKLDITTNSLGTTQTTSSGLALVNTTAAGSGAQQISPAIRWTGQGWKTNATAGSQAVDIRSYLVPVQGTANPSGYLTFESAVNGGAFSNIFTVDSSGKIGVGGITAPTSALSVNGTGYVSGWFGISTTSQYNTSDFTIGDATDTDLWMAFRGKKADNSEIRLVMGTQGNVGVGNDNAFIGTATGDKLEFRTNNAGRITILGGGNVGIGNGNASYQLHVGDGSIAGIIARFQNSTGTCDINPTTTSLSCSSDMRLKKNITKLDSEDETFILNTDLNMQEDTILSKVLAITPVTYNWNSESDSDPKHVGFIAQEVEQVFPDLVSTDDQGKKSLNYIGLVPYTIKAIQEMNVRVAALPEFEDQTMAQKVADFLRGIAERGEAVISSIKTQRVHTEELCVGSEGDEVCVTKDQLQNLLNNTSASAGGSPTAPEPTPPSDQETDTGTTGDTAATDTTGTTDSGTTDTSTDTGTADTTSTDTGSTPASDAGSSSDNPSI